MSRNHLKYNLKANLIMMYRCEVGYKCKQTGFFSLYFELGVSSGVLLQ